MLWDVGQAADQAAFWAVFQAVYLTVDDAMNRTVDGAVFWAAFNDPPHRSLQVCLADFKEGVA